MGVNIFEGVNQSVIPNRDWERLQRWVFDSVCHRKIAIKKSLIGIGKGCNDGLGKKIYYGIGNKKSLIGIGKGCNDGTQSLHSLHSHCESLIGIGKGCNDGKAYHRLQNTSYNP